MYSQFNRYNKINDILYCNFTNVNAFIGSDKSKSIIEGLGASK